MAMGIGLLERGDLASTTCHLYQAPVYHTSYTRHLCTSCIRHLYFLGPAPLCIEGNYYPGGLRNLLKAIRTLSRLPRVQLHSLSGNSITLPLL